MTVFRRSLEASQALLLALAFGAMAPAAAVPLDTPACEQLQLQLDALRAEGAAADMARGPEWARANLTDDRLRRIGILLEVEEKLNFRCGLAKITLPTTIEGGEEELPGPGEATVEGTSGTIALPQKSPSPPRRPAAAAVTITPPKARAANPATTKQPPVKKAAPAQKIETRPATATGEPKKAPAKKKPQPKADDAYRPPPRQPQSSESGGSALVPRR